MPAYPPALQLVPWTPISQQRTWAPDDTYVAERTEECGQTCIVMCLKWASGIWTSTAYLHDLVHAQGQVIGTTWDQMAYTFALMETHTHMTWPASLAEVEPIVQGAIYAQHPLIALRWFDHVGNTDSGGNPILHFTCVTGYTPDTIQQAGPWSGTMFTESWADFMSMFYGSGLMVVQRKRKLGDH